MGVGGEDEGWKQSGKGEPESLTKWGFSWARDLEDGGSREETKLGLQKGKKNGRGIFGSGLRSTTGKGMPDAMPVLVRYSKMETKVGI